MSATSAARRLLLPAAVLFSVALNAPSAAFDAPQDAASPELSEVEQEAIFQSAMESEQRYRQRLAKLRRLREIALKRKDAQRLHELEGLRERLETSHRARLRNLHTLLQRDGQEKLRAALQEGRDYSAWGKRDGMSPSTLHVSALRKEVAGSIAQSRQEGRAHLSAQKQEAKAPWAAQRQEVRASLNGQRQEVRSDLAAQRQASWSERRDTAKEVRSTSSAQRQETRASVRDARRDAHQIMSGHRHDVRQGMKEQRADLRHDLEHQRKDARASLHEGRREVRSQVREQRSAPRAGFRDEQQERRGGLVQSRDRTRSQRSAVRQERSHRWRKLMSQQDADSRASAEITPETAEAAFHLIRHEIEREE